MPGTPGIEPALTRRRLVAFQTGRNPQSAVAIIVAALCAALSSLPGSAARPLSSAAGAATTSKRVTNSRKLRRPLGMERRIHILITLARWRRSKARSTPTLG